MTPATTHPDPHCHPASWCAVWTRKGGSWRVEGGRVELVGGFELVPADTPALAAMLGAAGEDGREAVADHIIEWNERRKHHGWA